MLISFNFDENRPDLAMCGVSNPDGTVPEHQQFATAVSMMLFHLSALSEKLNPGFSREEFIVKTAMVAKGAVAHSEGRDPHFGAEYFNGSVSE